MTNQDGKYNFIFNVNGCVTSSDTLHLKSQKDFILPKPPKVGEGKSETITVAGCSGEVKWYDAATSGNLLHIGSSFKTPVLNQETSYWVSCTVEYCESERLKIIILIGEGCESDIIHSGNIAGEVYNTNENFQSTADVATGTVYKAGKAITLLPGFQAGKEEVFEAIIEGCK